MFLHILGSDIPHHNHTLLAFFDAELAPHLALNTQKKPRFFVVGRAEQYPDLPRVELTFFRTKKALAKAVAAMALTDPNCVFFLHGQYNPWLWLAILVGKLPAKRCVWHIWGADLYETSMALAFRLFYPLRRLAQKRLKTVCGTQGDLTHFSYINPTARRVLLYFPTKLPQQLPNVLPDGDIQKAENLTLLLGNSGDPSNRHLQGLATLKQLGVPLKIIVPMGYPKNNQAYISQVEEKVKSLFSLDRVDILKGQLDFEAYLSKLATCDCGYFPFERQQGIGTLCLLLMLNIPFVLNRKNPFCLDLLEQNIPFLYSDELSCQKIRETKQHLQALDKSRVAFLAPNYRQGWLEVLCH